MKNYLLILFIALAITGCEKNVTTTELTATDPKVTKVTFAPGYAGSTVSLLCNVEVSIPDPSIVKSLMMIKDGSIKEGDRVDNPQSKVYKLVDHQISSYPVGKYYRFVFTKNDNAVIISEKYQVP